MLDTPEGGRRGKCGTLGSSIRHGCTDNQINQGKNLPAGAPGLKEEAIGKTAYGSRVKTLAVMGRNSFKPVNGPLVYEPQNLLYPEIS
jgi:hypothetical protein